MTMGDTNSTVGNATKNETSHDFNQMKAMPSTKPKLNTLITIDISPDIKKAIKNAVTYLVYFSEIISAPIYLGC